MLSQIFLGLSMVGSEWVLYLLIVLSILSVALILERILHFRAQARGLAGFRSSIRQAVEADQKSQAVELARQRYQSAGDIESRVAYSLLSSKPQAETSTESLELLGRDALAQGKLHLEKNLVVLATIGNNAPFIGLFGTVLGIIKAFHDLSSSAAASTSAQTVTAGISEALVATAVGILVAIPASVAFNLLQRKVKASTIQADALKNYLIGRMQA